MAEHAMYFANQSELRAYKAKTITLKVLLYIFLTIFFWSIYVINVWFVFFLFI